MHYISGPVPAEQDHRQIQTTGWPSVDEGGWALGAARPCSCFPRGPEPSTLGLATVLSGSCQPGTATSQGLQLSFGVWEVEQVEPVSSPSGKPGRAPGASHLCGCSPLSAPSAFLEGNSLGKKEETALSPQASMMSWACPQPPTWLLPPKQHLLLSGTRQHVEGQTGLGSSPSPHPVAT